MTGDDLVDVRILPRARLRHTDGRILKSLCNCSNTTFTYDGDGRRVKSVLTTSLGTSTTIFVGSHYEITDGVVTKYYFAGAQRIAMRTNGTLTYLLSDHLGSTSLTTDASGSLISQIKYKAWGEVRYSTNTALPDYTYTGQYSHTADFGLMFYNARWYDPSLGRFAQADSIIPGGVQGWDRYAYVNNSPMNYVDPSGHEPHTPGSCYESVNGHCGYISDSSPDKLKRLSVPFEPKYGRDLIGPPELQDTQSVTNDKIDILTLPKGITLHPLDGNTVLQEPIYDYSKTPPEIIGYKITSYAYDNIFYNERDYVIPSDAITGISFAWENILKPLIRPGLERLASVGVDLSIPVVGEVLAAAAAIDSLNSAITFDTHLRTHDVYFTSSPFFSPLIKFPLP